MATIQWSADLLPFQLDADDIDDYPFDFTDWLAGDTLDAGSTTAFGEGVTAEVREVTDTGLKLRVSAGTAGQLATATVRAVSVNGRQIDRSIQFDVSSL